jgi:hypothetical protein
MAGKTTTSLDKQRAAKRLETQPAPLKLRTPAPAQAAGQLESILGGAGSAQDVLALQQQAGNRAVTRLLETARRAPAQPLPEALRQSMEKRLGADFSQVRVHESEIPPQLGARAYVQENDIHIAPGSYNPASARGRHLIGHELAHVLQQRGGRAQRPSQTAPFNDAPHLEAEAERTGRQAEAVRVPALPSPLGARLLPAIHAALPQNAPVQRLLDGQKSQFHQAARRSLPNFSNA